MPQQERNNAGTENINPETPLLERRHGSSHPGLWVSINNNRRGQDDVINLGKRTLTTTPKSWG